MTDSDMPTIDSKTLRQKLKIIQLELLTLEENKNINKVML